MRVVENTDRRLVIEHRPWFLAGMIWLMGLAALWSAVTGADMDGWAERLLVLALGLGTCWAAWYWFAFLRITFEREGGTVEHRAIRPLGSRTRVMDLGIVQGARLEANWSDGARLTRLVLETERGRAPLEFGYSGADRTALEAAVNEWLTRPG